MSRAAAALVLLLAAAAAHADLAVPPPPGKKFVRVDHTVTTATAFPDRDFYVVVGGTTATKVSFGPDSPVKIDGNRRNGPFGAAKFVAVPKGAGEKYADEKALARDLAAGKVPGQLTAKHGFPNSATIDAKDPRKTVAETLVVEKIDDRAGIVVRAAKGPAAPPPGAGDKNAPEDEVELSDEPVAAAYTPRGGAAVAGLAAALALAFAGLWLVRRSRP